MHLLFKFFSVLSVGRKIKNLNQSCVLYLDSNPEAYAQVLAAGQTKPFMDSSIFSRDACYEYVKRAVIECALTAE